MDIIKEALDAANRGEVRAAIAGTLHDLMLDIGNNAQALMFAHSQETFVATVLALGATDVWSDYLDDGIITTADLIQWIDEALAEMCSPGPICTACVRVARCGTCPECRKTICRGCLIAHLQSHDT